MPSDSDLSHPRPNAGVPIPIALGIDVEPDTRMIQRNQSRPWLGFERLIDFMTELRTTLPGIDGAPAAFTWLLRMDPQIRLAYGDTSWAARRYRNVLERFREAGDDIGVHTHLYDWDEHAGTWVTDAQNPSWRQACVEESTGAYRETFGTPCRVHSFGDRWLSDDSLALLERSGVQVDLSVEPGLVAMPETFPNEHYRGTLPDFEAAPRSPWRPAHGQILRDDPARGRDLVIVPVSTYRFPLAFEVGRRIDLLRRQLRGNPASMDESSQRHTRLCLEHRGYVYRYGHRQLRSEHAPRHLHFVLNTSQGLDEGVLGRMRANIAWLLSQPQRYCFGSATQLVASIGLRTRLQSSAA